MRTFSLKTLSLLLVFALSFGLSKSVAQINQEKVVGAKIAFADLTYDFGTVNVGDKGEFEVSFKNEGTEPLILQNVQGCCGAKIVDYTKDPILPQKSGAIKIQIYTGGAGAVSKTITIVSNDPNNSTVRVSFRGTIKAVE